ncbi:exo-alpha-sialidase, partial [Trypanosoma cruzi]
MLYPHRPSSSRTVQSTYYYYSHFCTTGSWRQRPHHRIPAQYQQCAYCPSAKDGVHSFHCCFHFSLTRIDRQSDEHHIPLITINTVNRRCDETACNALRRSLVFVAPHARECPECLRPRFPLVSGLVHPAA